MKTIKFSLAAVSLFALFLLPGCEQDTVEPTAIQRYEEAKAASQAKVATQGVQHANSGIIFNPNEF